MRFTGTGLIYDPKTKKIIINFKNTPEYETDDPHVIGLLNKAICVECVDGEIREPKPEPEQVDFEELTRKELIEKAKSAGITGADRMKKDDIIEKLADNE